MTRKTSLEISSDIWTVVAILRLSHLVRMLAKCASIGLVCALINQRMKDLWLYAQAVIKTKNVVISFRLCVPWEDGTEFFISACCTCGRLTFRHSINQILNWSVVVSVPHFLKIFVGRLWCSCTRWKYGQYIRWLTATAKIGSLHCFPLTFSYA